jgi:hypothetical protein
VVKQNLIAESRKLERNAHDRHHEAKQLLARTRSSSTLTDINSLRTDRWHTPNLEKANTVQIVLGKHMFGTDPTQAH